MADHKALLLRPGGGRRGGVGGDVTILPFKFPSCHQDHNVTNVGNVRDHLQRVIHHGFLGGKETRG